MKNTFLWNPTRYLILLYLLYLGVWAVAFQDHLPALSDCLFYFYPQAHLNFDSLQKGLLPLWNPYLACGLPHLANWQSGCLYPPGWLINLGDLDHGYMWLSISHSALAFTGFFLWARSQKAPPLWAYLTSLSFASSALLVQCWGLPPLLAALTWIPWIFWSLHRSLEKPQLSDCLLAILFLSLQLLAGYPIFVFYTWFCLGVWILSRKPDPSSILRLSLIFAAAILLTSIQWMPFVEYLAFAHRTPWENFPYFTNLKEYQTLLQPDFLGYPGRSGYPGTRANAIFGNLYFGLVPVVLWATILFWKKEPEKNLWNFLAWGLFLWLAGSRSSLWKIFPEDFLEFLTPSKALGLFLFSACTALAVAGGGAFPDLQDKRFRWTGILFVFFWIADVFFIPARVLNLVSNPYQNPAVVQSAQIIKDHTKGGRLVSLQDGSFQFSEEDIIEKTSKEPVRAFLPNSHQYWEIRSAGGYMTFSTKAFDDLTRYLSKGYPYAGDLLDVCGVKSLLLPQSPPGKKFQAVGPVGKNILLENPSASADSRWVTASVVFPSRAAILEKLAQPGSHWKDRLFLEKNPAGVLTRLEPVHRTLDENSRFTGHRESITITQSGYYTWNESYAPGWHAWVDGSPTPILRAYGLFMAVNLPLKGSHRVDFQYEPASFRLGLFFSLLALGLVTIGLLKIYRTTHLTKQVKGCF